MLRKNSQHGRREFLRLAGTGLAAAVGGSWAFAEVDDPDLVVFNAKVYTVDSQLPRAEAFAIRGGRFTAVGKTDEIKGLIGKATRTYDAKQLTIVPGFIDCHNHAPGNVLLYEVIVGNPYVVEFV